MELVSNPQRGAKEQILIERFLSLFEEDLIKDLKKTLWFNEQRRASEELQRSNRVLEEYARTLEEAIGIASHKGKIVAEASNKTRNHSCPGLKQLCGFLSRVFDLFMPQFLKQDKAFN